MPKKIEVNGGSFTIDLNGKTWGMSSSSFALYIYGGQVTVTSTNGRGTINGYIQKAAVWWDKDQHSNAIVVKNYATVHVTNNVRLNMLCTEEAANLTLDPGVIITYRFFTDGDSIAPFLSGKALQRCDENGNTENEFIPLDKSYRMDDMGCVMVIDHSTCSGHVVNGVCEVCGKTCAHSGTTGADTVCPDCNATLALTMTLTGTQGSTLELQFSTIAQALEYLVGKARIPGTNEQIETVEMKLRSGINLASGRLVFDLNYVILDLNGSALTLSESIQIANSGNLTVRNGTVSINVNGDVFYAKDGGTLTLESITDANAGKAGNVSVRSDPGNSNVFIKSGSYGIIYLSTAMGTKELFGGSFTEVHTIIESDDYAKMLKPGYIFVDPTTGAYIPASSMNGNAAKVVPCTGHTFDEGKCTKCAFECTHPSYVNEKCTVCGIPCPHKSVVVDSGAISCTDCFKQMVVKATTESGDIIYYSDVATAIRKAPDGSTLLLLVRCTLPSGVCVTNTNGITLDLGGHTLSGSTLCVGDSDNRGNAIAGKLTVIDSSDGNGSIGLEVRKGGTLIFDPGNIFTTITVLDVYGGSVRLYGGRIHEGKDNLHLYNSVSMTDLLPDGYFYRLYSYSTLVSPLSYQDAVSGNVKYSYDLVPGKCEHADLPTDFSGKSCTYCNANLVAKLKTADGKIRYLTDLAKDWNAFGADCTITLLQKTVLSEDMIFTNGVNCTLDLNGYPIHPNGPGKIYVEGNSRLALKGSETSNDPDGNWQRCDMYIGYNGAGTLEILDKIAHPSVVYFSDFGATQLRYGRFAHIYMDESKDIFVSDLLADGFGFYNLQSLKLLNLSATRDVSAVEIWSHTHTKFENGRCTDCGYKCKHTSGFTSDKCNICGYLCTHEANGDDGKCTVCGKQVADPIIISVDITWDAMEFTYTVRKGAWNPNTHKYEAPTAEGWAATNGTNPKITVTNHSNTSIKASFAFNGSVEGLNGKFTKDSLVLATAENTERANAPKDETAFSVDGTGIDADKDLGTVTVTVAKFVPAAQTVSTADELLATAKRDGVFKLEGDLDLGDTQLEINSPYYELDLNGHTLSGSCDNQIIRVNDKSGKVTIKNGTVENTYGFGIEANNNNFNLEKCKVVANCAALSVRTAYIADCEIENTNTLYFSLSSKEDLTLSGNVTVGSFAPPLKGTLTVLPGIYNFDVTEYVDTNLYTVTKNEETGIWTVAEK